MVGDGDRLPHGRVGRSWPHSLVCWWPARWCCPRTELMPALTHNLALGATSLTITPEAGFMIEAVLAFFLVTAVLSPAVGCPPGRLPPPAFRMSLALHPP